jgi:hypothetical protein
MSMIGIFLRVTNEQLEGFLENSSLLEEYIDSEEMDDNETKLDVDKAWDGINFILTDNGLQTIEEADSPLSSIIFSSQIVDEEQDLGYGPAQYLTPEQVIEVSEALTKISREEFRKNYDHVKMNKQGVYPQAWSDDEDERDYLANYFQDIKAFYAKAVQEGQAIITYIS